jgi:hypothetical protein
MRLLFGIILGFLLTLGAVYIRDSSLPASTTATPVADRPMVNWDVVRNRSDAATGWIGEQWTRLTSGNAPGRPPASVPPASREPSAREPLAEPVPPSNSPATSPAPQPLSPAPATPGSGSGR